MPILNNISYAQITNEEENDSVKSLKNPVFADTDEVDDDYDDYDDEYIKVSFIDANSLLQDNVNTEDIVTVTAKKNIPLNKNEGMNKKNDEENSIKKHTDSLHEDRISPVARWFESLIEEHTAD